MWQTEAEVNNYSETSPETKGEEIQKLSVIENLPQLLAEDAQGCITRVLPKINQILPTAPTEFHMAASVVFKQILEQKLVSHSTFSLVFLHSILASLENRDPVISHAWLETILNAIELLPTDVIKRDILPVAINNGQLSQSVNNRIMCCELLGKITTRFDSETIKQDVLPTIKSLCQDVNNDVRACICLQLQFVVEQLDEDGILSLLPTFTELVNDEEPNVRHAAIKTIGHIIPKIPPEKNKSILIPLIKEVCTKATKNQDYMMCIIAQEFGRITHNVYTLLTIQEKSWFIKCFQQLAQMGTPVANSVQDARQDFSQLISPTQINERSVECRRSCAYNIPAIFIFASPVPDGISQLIPTFRNLANDSFYIIRRTIACSLHEVIKILGTKSGIVKTELLRLWKDDHEEVLQGLIPHTSEILEHLLQNKLIGADQTETLALDLGKALIKCEAEIASTRNWRLSALMINQLEILPKCFPSDFINTYLVPVMLNRILNSRPLPVRLAAGRTLLIFLRYNLKSHQKIEIRHKICVDLAHHSSCYVRMIFIRMMEEAMTIFSSIYFKEHFFYFLLSLTEDKIPNVRLKVVALLPSIKLCLRMPADKNLLSTFETNFKNLKNNERDKDVLNAISIAAKEMDNIEIPVDNQPSPTKVKTKDAEDLKKYEEERKLEAMTSGKINTNVNSPAKKTYPPTNKPTTEPLSKTVRKPGPESSKVNNNESKPFIARASPSPGRNLPDISKPSTSSDDQSTNWSRFTSSSTQQHTHSWDRTGIYSPNPTLSSTSTSSSNCSHNLSNDYLSKKLPCSCYDSSERTCRSHSLSSNLSSQSYRSDPNYCSCLGSSGYLKTTNLFHTKHDHKSSLDHSKSSISTASGRENKHDLWQSLMSRDSFMNKFRMSDLSPLPPPYSSCAGFGSMPEIPVNLIEDEFMVDAGIRIPSQLTSSQSSSKIPNLQEIIYRNRRLNSIDRFRNCAIHFDQSKPPLYPGYEDKSKLLSSGSSYSSALGSSSSSSTSGGSSSSSSTSNRDQYSVSSMNHDRLKPHVGLHGKGSTTYDVNQKKSLDDAAGKRSSMLSDKDRFKSLQSKSMIDRSKRHSTNYGSKLFDTKESKLKFKRHTMEISDYNGVDKNNRTFRRLSTLDVNHNQGLSKIPVRNIHISGSRTAPVTRTSSPIRVKTDLSFDKIGYNNSDSYSREVRLRRFLSSDEEVEKLY